MPSSAQLQLDDDAVLTQYGVLTDPVPFRKAPRWQTENAVSLTVGQLTVEQMLPLVSRGRPRMRVGAAVRHTTVGTLRQAGFTVERRPTKKNPDHVGVTSRSHWDDQVAKTFNECFSEERGEGNG
jgi:hypothetical protein